MLKSLKTKPLTNTKQGMIKIVIMPNLEHLIIKRKSKMPEQDYKFVDSKIEYMISNTGEIFIQVDPAKDEWAEIHAKDIEFMKSHKEKGDV